MSDEPKVMTWLVLDPAGRELVDVAYISALQPYFAYLI